MSKCSYFEARAIHFLLRAVNLGAAAGWVFKGVCGSLLCVFLAKLVSDQTLVLFALSKLHRQEDRGKRTHSNSGGVGQFPSDSSSHSTHGRQKSRSLIRDL